MSEILLKGNNLNFDPVVVHETVELVESCRLPEKKLTSVVL